MLRRVLQPASQRHDPLQLRLVLLRIQPGTLLRLLTCGLGWCSRLELSRHGLQVEGHLRVRLEEEELQVPRLILELHLRPVLEDIRDGSVRPKERQDLAPVRALDHVEAGHESLLLLLGPGPSCRV